MLLFIVRPFMQDGLSSWSAAFCSLRHPHPLPVVFSSPSATSCSLSHPLLACWPPDLLPSALCPRSHLLLVALTNSYRVVSSHVRFSFLCLTDYVWWSLEISIQMLLAVLWFIPPTTYYGVFKANHCNQHTRLKYPLSLLQHTDISMCISTATCLRHASRATIKQNSFDWPSVSSINKNNFRFNSSVAWS